MINLSIFMHRSILGFSLFSTFIFISSTSWAGPSVDQKLWHEECSACHDAYPPSLLPGYTWNKIMGSLDKHFGSDASLDEPERGKIATFLIGNRPKEIPLRITTQDWFLGIHRGFIPAAIQKGFTISTCSKCHRM